MAKAILELEMPESCTECMFKECLNRTTSVEVSRCIILHKMHVPGSYCPAEGRQANCPLKLVEEKNNEPLTLETLETLIGEPVYSPKCGWGIVGAKDYGYPKGANYFHRLTIGLGNRWEWAEDILRSGPIYRRKPEREVE